MAVHVITRTTLAGEKRYLVRARAGGRGYAVVHLGSFKTRREAEACREWAALELAQGRIPNRRKRLAEASILSPTLRDAAEGWIQGRHDLRASTVASYEQTIRTAQGATLPLWSLRLNEISLADLQAFVAALVQLGASGQTIRRDLNVVKQVLDHHQLTPNPARDHRLRLPPRRRSVPDPPSAREVALILESASKRFRLPIALLEATGLRVSELCALTWGDVDLAENRIRISGGKTTRARRFVAVPDELMTLVDQLLIAEDRAADRRVFPSIRRETVTNAMRRACQHASIPLYSPHDLRHRRLSRLVQSGVPITEVQQIAGHASAALTLSVYAHVMADAEDGWRLAHDALA